MANIRLFTQINWSYNVVLIYANVVIIIALVGVCIWCLKRKRKKENQPQVNENDDETPVPPISGSDNDGGGKKVRRFGGHISDIGHSMSFRLKTLFRSTRKEKPIYLVQPNDYQKVNVQPPQQQPPPTPPPQYPQRQPHVKRLANRRAKSTPFHVESVQPNYEDLQPFQKPKSIPEPPILNADDAGTIHFSIRYEPQFQILTVMIRKAIKLTANDLNGSSDPYVKVFLDPTNESQKLSTKVKKKNLNPTWNETLTFEGFSLDKLMHRSLSLEVYDHDKFSADDPLGQLEMPLGDVILSQEPIEYVERLKPAKHAPGYLGTMLISTCYSPSTNRITLIVMKCNRLKISLNGRSDPYVKLSVMHGGKVMETRKTQIHHGTLYPVWNEVFEFEIPMNKIRTTSFLFVVKDHGSVLKDKVIGKVMIGHHAQGTALKHYTSMLNSPRKALAMWHTLLK